MCGALPGSCCDARGCSHVHPPCNSACYPCSDTKRQELLEAKRKSGTAPIVVAVLPLSQVRLRLQDREGVGKGEGQSNTDALFLPSIHSQHSGSGVPCPELCCRAAWRRWCCCVLMMNTTLMDQPSDLAGDNLVSEAHQQRRVSATMHTSTCARLPAFYLHRVASLILRMLMMTSSQMDQPTDLAGDNPVSEAHMRRHANATIPYKQMHPIITFTHPLCLRLHHYSTMVQRCADDDFITNGSTNRPCG